MLYYYYQWKEGTTMEITQNLNVTAPEFFTLIEDSLLHDIKNNSSKKANAAKLERGFHYTKNMKMGKQIVKTQVTLLQYQKPILYEVKMETDNNIYNMSYAIIDRGDNIDVTYSETSTDKEGNAKKSFLMNLMDKRNFQKMAKTLQKMEAAILNNRDQSDKSDYTTPNEKGED